MKAAVVLWTLLAVNKLVEAWVISPHYSITMARKQPISRTKVCAEKDFTELPEKDNDGTPKLGIDIGSMLEPLSEKEAAELKAAAKEKINEAVAAGLDDIEMLRAKLKREIEQESRKSQARSEANAKLAQTQLLNRIDKITGDFLSRTATVRESTKRASAADKGMEGQGVEIGSWGRLGGASVVTASSTTFVIDSDDEPTSIKQTANRLLILGDVDSDPYAKQLVPSLTSELETLFEDVEFDTVVYKPTATVPLGGDNSAAVLLFCTSFTSAASVKTVLDRVFRRTLVSGGVQEPPSQIIAISTVGTERTNQMPYSVQNLMGGGKLEQRRQIEEAAVRMVRERGEAIDYTICKLGELKSTNEDFEMLPGDTLDGAVSLETATVVVKEAIAVKASARNSTFSCVGSLGAAPEESLLEDAFLKLDGPEIQRITGLADYEPLTEYIVEWAMLLAESGKGLTTPVQVETNVPVRRVPGAVKQHSVQLLFLPTATGKNYLSKEEEKKRERRRSSGTPPKGIAPQKLKKEGGLEFCVEQVDSDIRIRVKRCNYGDDAIIKELSEDTILSRFKKGIEVWRKEHPK